MTGKITRVTDKGFGFITPDDGERDIFFHAHALTEGLSYDDLREGDAVTFDVEDGPKGPAAANVARSEGGAAPEAEAPAEDAA